MNIIRPRHIAALLLGVATLLGQPAPASAQEPVKLNLWFTDSRAQYKTWLEKAAASYRQKHPNVQIDIVQMSPNDAYVKWPASVAAGNQPDITWMFFAFAAWVNDLPGGSLADMTDVVDRIGVDRFNKDGLTAWKYGNKTLGVPFTRQPFFLFYRKDRFAEAGLQPPKTWSDVLHAAKTLHRPEKGQYGIAIGGKNDWMVRQNFELTLYSNGGHLLTKDGKPDFDNAISRRAIEIYSELFRYTPPGSLNASYAEVNRAFAQGGPAMAISLAVAVSQYFQANPSKPDTVGAVIPSDAGMQLTMQNNKGWAIFERSKNQAVAKDFIRFLYETEHYAAGIEAGAMGGLPLYNDQKAIAMAFERVGSFNAFPDVVKAIQGDYSGYYSGIDWYGQNPNAGVVGSKGILERNLNLHLAGRQSIDDTVKRVQSELSELFK